MLTSWWWLYVIPLFGYFFYIWFKPWLRAVRLALSLPGPPILPLFGNIIAGKKKLGFIEILGTAYNKYGPISRGWLAFIPIILVFEPKHIQLILGSSKLIHKNFLYSLIPAIAGNGLLTIIDDNKWKSHRKYMQTVFNMKDIEKCIPTFLDYSDIMVKGLKNVKEVKISSAIHTFLLDVLHDVILGIPADDHITRMKSPFIRGPNVALEGFLKPWLMIDFVYNSLKHFKDYVQPETWKQFVAEALENMKNRKKNNEVLKWSFLKFFLEISESADDFQEEDAVEEAITLTLSGQDATRVTLTFVFYYLAKYQDIQRKVVDELNQVFSKSNEIGIESLNEMKYLEQCINESMRLSPAVPIVARKISEDVKLDNCVLPAGCNVFISPYATHRLPHYYPNPLMFDPDRFSEENRIKLHKYAFIPFSAGPRNCIAYKFAMIEMKTLLSTFLRNYQISLLPGHDELIPIYRITLKTKGSIWLKLEPRKTIN